MIPVYMTMSKTRVLSIDIGIVNLSFCIVDFIHDDDSTTFELVHIEKAQIGKMSHRAYVLAENAIKFFKDSDAINEEMIDYIFIEHQLSKAIKNTVVGYATYSYFYSDCLIRERDTVVRFVPPRSKFKAVNLGFPDDDVLNGYDHNKMKSKDLKKLSILIATTLFNTYEVQKGLEALIEYKSKKDDVCDVFCQSFAVYLEDGDFKSKSRKLS